VLSTQLNAVKTPCPISIPASITACDASGITVRTLDRTAVDEQCRTPTSGPQAAWVSEKLVKAP
jgi:hypothetical protein